MLSCWKFFLLMISWSDSWLSCRPFENISVPLPTYISYIHTLEKEGTIANISVSMHAMHVCVIHCPMHCFGWVASRRKEIPVSCCSGWCDSAPLAPGAYVCMYVCMYVYMYVYNCMYCMYVVSSSAVPVLGCHRSFRSSRAVAQPPSLAAPCGHLAEQVRLEMHTHIDTYIHSFKYSSYIYTCVCSFIWVVRNHEDFTYGGVFLLVGGGCYSRLINRIQRTRYCIDVIHRDMKYWRAFAFCMHAYMFVCTM